MMEQVLPFYKNQRNKANATAVVLDQKAPVILIDLVRNMTDLNAVFELRRQAFIKEKGVPESAEFDGNDFAATHILLKVDDKPAGTLRIRCFKDFAKMERLCIHPDFRGQKLYRPLLDYTEEYLKSKGYSCFVGYILKELCGYWFQRGFQPNFEMEEIKKANLTLIPVVYPFKTTPVLRATHQNKIDLLAREGQIKTID